MSEVHQNEEAQAQIVNISEVTEMNNGTDSLPVTASMSAEHTNGDDQANKIDEPNNDMEKGEQNNTNVNAKPEDDNQEATESAGHIKTTDLIDVGQHPKDQPTDHIDASVDKENKNETETEKQPEETKVKKISSEKSQARGFSSATVPPATAEDQEVTSTRNDDTPRPARLSSRRQSYNSGRGYVGGYQNYGLTYLPYKSNFEPSENARRKADEFFKTLKL